jgi:hypothetical protein
LSLTKWNLYLSENNTSLFEAKKASNLQSVIDYLSAPNLLDTFSISGDSNYNNSRFEIPNKYLMSSDNYYISDSFLNNVSLKNTLVDYRTLLGTDYSDNSIQPLKNYLNDILLVTPE